VAEAISDSPTLAPPAGGPPAGHGPRIVDPRVPVTIVSMPAIWIGAVVLVALIVAIATNKLWALEFFHVAGGAVWTVLDLFMGLVLGPILGTMSIPSRMELTRRLMPKFAVILPIAVTCTLAAGWQLGRYLGTVDSAYINHGWIVASYIVVGVLAVVALGVLEPANIAVLFELRKPEPNGLVIATLMKRFVYTAGISGVMQIATLVIMTKIASGG
jgi:hypothetical protein